MFPTHSTEVLYIFGVDGLSSVSFSLSSFSGISALDFSIFGFWKMKIVFRNVFSKLMVPRMSYWNSTVSDYYYFSTQKYYFLLAVDVIHCITG